MDRITLLLCFLTVYVRSASSSEDIWVRGWNIHGFPVNFTTNRDLPSSVITHHNYSYTQNEQLNISCGTNSEGIIVRWINLPRSPQISKRTDEYPVITLKVNFTSDIKGFSINCVSYNSSNAAMIIQEAKIHFRRNTGSAAHNYAPIRLTGLDQGRLLITRPNQAPPSAHVAHYWYNYTVNESVTINCASDSDEGYLKWDSPYYNTTLRIKLEPDFNGTNYTCALHNSDRNSNKAIIHFKMIEIGLDVCQMDLNYFNINSIKDLNFTKSEGANNCEATYTYSKEEKLKLNCTSKLSNFDRNYISMAWRFNDSQKGEVVYLNETRSEINSIHNYYLPQEFDIGSNNNGSMIKCELAKLYPNGTYNQDKPVTESLIIHLLWIQQETPTDAPFSNLNRSIVKRNVIEPQFTEENNVSFELKVSKNNATCLTVKRYDFVIKEKEETMINVVVSSCKRIKYGNCNTSKPENNIQFKNLDQQKKSSKCNAEQKVFEAIEKIEINESTILRCSFLTHKNNKANIFPRVTINSTKYVETVCTTEINVKFIPPATISTNTTIISSVDKDNQEIPKINDTNTTIVTTKKISFAAKVTKKESINEKRSEEQTQVENNSVIEDNNIFLNNTKDKNNQHPPQGIMEYLWFKIAIMGIVCIALILVVIHMLKRRLKEDSEPMINSSGGHQESSDVQQFPPNLESHYAKPLDTRVEGETYSVPINENNIETFYTMPVPKQQRSNMRKVLPDLNEKVNVNKNRNPVYSEINHRAVPKYTNLFNDGRYVNGKIDTDYAEPTYYDMNT